MSEYRMGTKCVQAGYTPGNGEPRQVPIIQSTTFKYSTSEDMGKLFDLEADGYFYSRLQNPTNDIVAAKIAAMEGGSAAMLTSSGHVVCRWQSVGRQQTFLPCLTYVNVAIISLLPPLSMVELSTCSLSRWQKWESRPHLFLLMLLRKN